MSVKPLKPNKVLASAKNFAVWRGENSVLVGVSTDLLDRDFLRDERAEAAQIVADMRKNARREDISRASDGR